jgi:hypothetical protein
MPASGTSPATRPRQDLSRYLRWVYVMAAAAVAFGALLVPRGDELLLIFVKNHDLARARSVLVTGAGRGAPSEASAVAHGELFLFEGQIDTAIAEMETYTAAHPGDVAAWEHLADLYKGAERGGAPRPARAPR